MQNDLERSTMRKIFWRIMPIVMLGGAFHNLDRSNISFASIRMNVDLGLSAAQFGFAAGIYYLGYVLFCVPGSLLGPKIGLRIWLPSVMIAWGICSMATALATNVAELAIIRVLLGAAEAGFVPGALFLLALWIPASYRGRFISWFWFSASVGTVMGAPISSYILTFEEIAGLRSWQMLFVAEAAPICLVGLVGYWLLYDDTAKVKWLSAEERAWLAEQRGPKPDLAQSAKFGVLREFKNPRVIMLTVAYFLIMMMGISYSFFFPPYLHARGIDVLTIGIMVASVHAIGAPGHLIWGRFSDYLSHNRQLVCFSAAMMTAIGLGLLPLVSGIVPLLLLGCIVQFGLSAAVSSFWPLPMTTVRTTVAAGVFAGITMFGNLTGLIGPYFTGLLRDLTDSYVLSFILLASSIGLAGALILASRLVGSDPVGPGPLAPPLH